MVCAQKGYPLVLTMPESFSVERRRLMRFLGAKVVLTPAAERGVGMVRKAEELARTHGWFLTRQFENEANADMHSRTTAREILADFAGARLDYWVTGFGTGGTLKGVARVLAKERPDTKIVVCEPADAPMLTRGEAQERNPDGTPVRSNPAWKPHPLQGWSPDFVPKLTADAVATGVIHRVVTVGGPEAMQCSRDLARKEGIFVGITAGGTRQVCRSSSTHKRTADTRARRGASPAHGRAALDRRRPRRPRAGGAARRRAVGRPPVGSRGAPALARGR